MNARLFAPLSITLLAGLALLGLLQPALAAELPVTTLEDELIANGACSLREAIQAANTDSPVDSCPAGSGADVIRLPAGRYELTLVGSGEDDNQSGDFDILDDLEIVGAGAELTVLDGNWLDRVLHVPAGARLNLTELTLTGGRAPSGADGENGADGGAVWSNGPLILADVILAGNRAGDGGDSASPDEGARAGSGGHGGAIYSNGSMTATNVILGVNAAGNGGSYLLDEEEARGSGGDGGSGGAIYATGAVTIGKSLLADNRAGSPGYAVSLWANDGMGGSGGALAISGRLAMTETRLSGNQARSGGALAANGMAQIEACDFAENATWSEGGRVSPPGIVGARGGPGGAIHNQGAGMEIVRSTVHHNRTGSGGASGGGSHSYGGDGGAGGGIYNAGVLSLRLSTISNNRTGSGASDSTWAGSGGDGGGIFSSGALSIEASTVTSNVTGAGGVGFFSDGADGAGGGVAMAGADPFAFYATLLTGNYAADASSDCSGAANSAGYNLIGVTDGCSFTGDTAADRMGLAPLLLPLDDYGGPTPTHLPGFTSPAVDAAPCEALDGLPLAADQRGVARPQGATCDVGAVEVVPPDAFEFLPLVRQ